MYSGLIGWGGVAGAGMGGPMECYIVEGLSHAFRPALFERGTPGS